MPDELKPLHFKPEMSCAPTIGQIVTLTRGPLAGAKGVFVSHRDSQWVIELRPITGVYLVTDPANCEPE